MFKKIVVGIDGSDAALHALKTGCALADALGAKLHVVHVPRLQSAAFVTGGPAAYHMVSTFPREEDLLAEAEKIMAAGIEAATAAGHPPDDTAVRHGDAGDAIAAYAEEVSADLVVMGRRGLGSVAGLLIGSTSQRVAQRAHCAVLTTP